MPASDESLLQAVGRGDLEAFEELVRRRQAWAWKIAYRFLGQKSEAEDVVQEAFIRLMKAADRYRPSACFTTYFYRIITRLCIDRAKQKKKPALETIPDSADDTAPDAATELIRRETADAVRSALDTLAPNQRMAIVLRYYEELNYRDIAAVLEITPKAVERLLSRGRKRLRTILGSR